MTTLAKTETIREVEDALEKDRAHRLSSSGAPSREQVLQKAQRVGLILRYAGGASLIASSIVLLFQQWDGMDHVWRYLSFLAFTLVTGAAGVFCGIRIGESKGARLLLTFITGLACIHGAQLGALLYSIYGIPLTKYPALLYWQAPSAGAAWLCVLGGVVVVVPLLYLAYSTLDRRLAVLATAACVAANGALLLPFRESGSAAIIASAIAAIFIGVDQYTKRSFSAHTKETRLAIWSLCLPLVVIVGRQVFLYGISLSFVSATLMFFAMLLAVKSPIQTKPALGIFSYYLSLFLGSVAWILILGDANFFKQPPSFVWMAIMFPIALGSAALGLMHEKAEKHFDTIAALLLVGGSCFDLMRTGTSINSAVQLLCALSVLTWACLQERRLLLGIGAIGVVIGLYEHVVRAIFSLSVSPWLVLGAAGIVTIVGASYLEKNFVHIQTRLRSTRKLVRGWEL